MAWHDKVSRLFYDSTILNNLVQYFISEIKVSKAGFLCAIMYVRETQFLEIA